MRPTASRTFCSHPFSYGEIYWPGFHGPTVSNINFLFFPDIFPDRMRESQNSAEIIKILV